MFLHEPAFVWAAQGIKGANRALQHMAHPHLLRDLFVAIGAFADQQDVHVFVMAAFSGEARHGDLRVVVEELDHRKTAVSEVGNQPNEFFGPLLVVEQGIGPGYDVLVVLAALGRAGVFRDCENVDRLAVEMTFVVVHAPSVAFRKIAETERMRRFLLIPECAQKREEMDQFHRAVDPAGRTREVMPIPVRHPEERLVVR